MAWAGHPAANRGVNRLCARSQNAPLLFDPLFHLPFEDVDDLIHLGMGVKGMSGAFDDPGPAKDQRSRVAEAVFVIPVVSFPFETFDLDL